MNEYQNSDAKTIIHLGADERMDGLRVGKVANNVYSKSPIETS
jgi:hypothetical protein